MSLTRRSLIARAASGAAAASVPGALLAAAPAVAQATDETGALESWIELERGAELAYSLAAEDGNLEPEVRKSFEAFALHCGEHATALAEALEQLGVEKPEESGDPADYPSLDGYDSGARQDDQLEFMIGLEEELIEAYVAELPKLEAQDLIRTAAQIAASHAQVLVALRLLAPESASALTELPGASRSSAAQ